MALNLKVGYASMMPVDSSQAPGTVLSTLRRPHNSDNDCSTLPQHAFLHAGLVVVMGMCHQAEPESRQIGN